MIRLWMVMGLLLSLGNASVLFANYLRPPPGKIAKHRGSVVVGILALGWAVAFGMRLKWLPLELEKALFGVAPAFLALGLAVLLVARSQR